MLIDTLKFRNKLLEGGFEQAQADALVEALSAASTDYLATKADIEELRGEMKSMKWMMGTLVIINLGILGKLLFT